MQLRPEGYYSQLQAEINRRSGDDIAESEACMAWARKNYKEYWLVSPGRLDTLSVCQDLLGVAAIKDPGEWMGPFVIEATEEEAEVVTELMREAMLRVKDPEVALLRLRRTPNPFARMSSTSNIRRFKS